MTTAVQLVDIVIAHRATISLDGERVIITETGPAIATDLRSDLRAHREAIASVLRTPLGTIALWRARWATLDPDRAPCPGFLGDNWRSVHRAASRFLDPKASPPWSVLAAHSGSAQDDTDLEARAAAEQNAELEVEARDARSLIGRLHLPTIKAWRWLASRDAAAEAVDIETCKVFCQHVQIMDPYGCDVAMPKECDCVGREIFVVSDATDWKVWMGDLPEKKRDALHQRMKREPLSSDDEIPF